VQKGRCQCTRIILIQTPGLVPRLRAFGFLLGEESGPLRDAGNPAAAAAARAAGLAASCAYTHPLADVQQTKHIVGPAAYAALALELSQGGDHFIGDNEVIWAIEHVTPEVREVLLQMPAREMGRTRLENIMYKIDVKIRGRNMPRGA
jgi:hypothetical protein